MKKIHKVEFENVTLYHADCLDVLPLLPKVDALITDPPYGIFACGGKWGKKSELQWDKLPADNMQQLLDSAKVHVIWGGNYFTLPPSRGWLVWQKPDRVPSAADFEMAWTSVDMNSRLISHSIAATNAERVGHPTQKPLRVMQWSIQQVKASGTILDPYMGSGTTGVASVIAGIKFIGIEKDAKYFSLACKRIEQELSQGQLGFTA